MRSLYMCVCVCMCMCVCVCVGRVHKEAGSTSILQAFHFVHDMFTSVTVCWSIAWCMDSCFSDSSLKALPNILVAQVICSFYGVCSRSYNQTEWALVYLRDCCDSFRWLLMNHLAREVGTMIPGSQLIHTNYGSIIWFCITEGRHRF